MKNKKQTLRPILESTEGIHLTAYLENKFDLIMIKKQLSEIIEEVRECLIEVQSDEEVKKFLAPIYQLLHDGRVLKKIKGNIGLFRTANSFRILNVPVELETQIHIATSFHVKPLLRWIQFDRDFLLLSVGTGGSQLYFGNQSSFQMFDSIDYGNLSRNAAIDETVAWANTWIKKIKSQSRLFIVGEHDFSKKVSNKINYKNQILKSESEEASENHSFKFCAQIRRLLKSEAKKALELALLEFRFSEELNLTQKNIFQISKSAVRGQVKKLIVADGINVFGKLDKKTGGLAIHPFDLDHEDDDILDDLAQTVLASGGEVIVAPRDKMPKGRLALAILDRAETELESDESLKYIKELKKEISM